MKVELIKHNVSDLDVARAAWVSTLGEDAKEKDGDRVAGLIDFLYRNKHMSPFEHGSYTFFLDVPIFVAREFMRHRTFSYNEASGRYKKLNPKFYIASSERPFVQTGKVGDYRFIPGSEGQHNLIDIHTKTAYEAAWFSYNEMLDNGIAKEVARDVLPVGIYTQFYATCNLRNLMQFLTLRNAPNALYEIRDVAEQMEEHFEHTAPLVYAAFDRQRKYEQENLDYKVLYEELLKEYNKVKVALEEAQGWLDNYLEEWD